MAISSLSFNIDDSYLAAVNKSIIAYYDVSQLKNKINIEAYADVESELSPIKPIEPINYFCN